MRAGQASPSESQGGGSAAQESAYYLFAHDRQVYGPAQKDTLLQWALEGLVTADCWLFDEVTDTWLRAQEMGPLRPLLAARAPKKEPDPSPDLETGQLRRVRLFSELDPEEIKVVASFLTRVLIPGSKPVTRKEALQQCMYIVLSGEAVAFRLVGQSVQRVATFGPGDSFGEEFIIRPGPAPYDVDARTETVLLKFKHANFHRLGEDHPHLANQILKQALLIASFRWHGIR